MSGWWIGACTIFPFSLLLWLMVLSGVKLLQKISYNICYTKLTIASVSLRIYHIFLIFFFIMFGCESYKLTTSSQRKYLTIQEYRISILRKQRNWWISCFLLVLWLSLFRINSLLKYEFKQVTRLKQSVAESKNNDVKEINKSSN